MDDKAIVYIVDDDEAVVRPLKLLMKSAGLQAEAYYGARDFLQGYDPARPSCLLLDVRMPDMDGLELQQALNHQGHRLPIVMMTGHGDVPMAVQAMKYGAFDFIQKPFVNELVLNLVRQGLHLDVQRHYAEASQTDVDDRLAALTDREREILELVAGGQRNKEIARVLGISPRTVETHRAHIMRKLEADSVTDLIRLAINR